MSKLNLATDLQYGTLNDLQDTNVANSGDRRRTSPISALNATMRSSYVPDTLRGITSFNGIVVAKRKITLPRYSSRQALLEAFVVSGGPDSDEPSTTTEGNPGIPALNEQTAYKVYIPEIEPRPAPCSSEDPILHTYPDVFAAPGAEDLQDLPIGAIVRVGYEDLQRLYGPTILDGNKTKFVQLANFEQSTSPLGDLFNGRQAIGIDDEIINQVCKKGARNTGTRRPDETTDYGIYFYLPETKKRLKQEFMPGLQAHLNTTVTTLSPFRVDSNGQGRDLFEAVLGGGIRSPGSNHGAGVAIDLKISYGVDPRAKNDAGKWTYEPIAGRETNHLAYTGNDSNLVLLNNREITKAINDYVNSTGDMKWGGLFKRGTLNKTYDFGTFYKTEYHHFELTIAAQEKYWESVKPMLEQLGIPYYPKSYADRKVLYEALIIEFVDKEEIRVAGKTESGSNTEETS